ncbi:MAG TPA: POTRA domain-containing protein, partial [Fibrobacteria bacterium]|nr:POTRA domain-containing protein [Fibrobacteria bacterium]
MRRALLFRVLVLAAFFASLALAPRALAAGISASFEGREAFSAAKLLDLLPDEPEKLRDEEVSYWAGDAADRVAEFYEDRGYLQVQVSTRVEKPDPKRKKWNVTLVVREGPLYRFGVVTLRVDGDSAVA